MSIISVVEHRRITAIEEIRSQFELRPDRGYVWIQRVCFWLLTKIGAFANVPSMRVECHDIGKEGDAFMTRIWKSQRAILGSFDMNPSVLLIGPEEYAEIMNEPMALRAFQFDARYFRREDGATQVHGLKVRMIPWMRGILLL